jgi:ferric-dicitrate binding protein FerR (iron transport regulator)
MRKIRLRSAYLRAISAAAVIAVLLLGGFWAKQTFFSPGQPIQIYAQKVAPEQVSGYDRTLTLADGSRVVLKAGSKLEVSSTFNRTKRIVRLVGEAYFDIAHDKSRPFVIETGEVKTTVLGTAFSIKAWPGDHQVNVAVARGKVRVDDGEKLLAVLTVSQGIEYHTLDSRLLKQERAQEVETASKWVASDLHFDHQSFLDIARTLSRRYGVDIQIENQQIANMKLVSSFSGTESLSDILDILCGVTQNISYSMEGNRVLVSLSDKRS